MHLSRLLLQELPVGDEAATITVLPGVDDVRILAWRYMFHLQLHSEGVCHKGAIQYPSSSFHNLA
jgi:hypothetical protein